MNHVAQPALLFLQSEPVSWCRNHDTSLPTTSTTFEMQTPHFHLHAKGVETRMQA
jgi:hypothetical protein